ncbi:hypothetical protein [Oerskovia rustica]|uniref:SLATT domain-containing protein n=1 Tax=Oerskovia rustica TaxID=2762237 RepID=A0ABR8RQ64_9CELL|nr:hypothetical protein [Oerskovia rustica]MBD7949921.1 hypothetical protein [Oerskovia rustica]
MASVAVTVVLALWGGGDGDPSRAELGLFALLAGVFQLVGAWLFGRDDRVDSRYARRAFKRLASLAIRAEIATELAESASVRGRSAVDVRDAVGALSRDLSTLQEGLIESAEDWAEALPHVRDPEDRTASAIKKNPEQP